MEKSGVVRCNELTGGCQHIVTAKDGETYHTDIDGIRYILRRRTDEIFELIPDGKIHVEIIPKD
jgi:hypothetical protein